MFKTKKRLLLELFLGVFRHLAWPDPHSPFMFEYLRTPGGSGSRSDKDCGRCLFHGFRWVKENIRRWI